MKGPFTDAKRFIPNFSMVIAIPSHQSLFKPTISKSLDPYFTSNDSLGDDTSGKPKNVVNFRKDTSKISWILLFGIVKEGEGTLFRRVLLECGRNVFFRYEGDLSDETRSHVLSKNYVDGFLFQQSSCNTWWCVSVTCFPEIVEF
ncbi:hypothetical protein CEXT_469641 [Caerostris extrusa]|uniref:Uncharacterized protein n=1 Tax=Caerostris extrusa TaxID=172846 RepID=A0AAV4VZZ8_CAEEX|nr:hypothetical protein CEXT_469641 [Caerostris extrusa]